MSNLASGFDTYDPSVRDHWHEALTDMREQCPVAHSDAHGGVWWISRYEDINRVLMDDETFTVEKGDLIPPHRTGALPSEADGPIQREYRKLLNTVLSAGAVRKHEAAIRKVLVTLISGFETEGRCDFVRDYARPFPGRIIFTEFLGVDDPDELERCLSYTGGVAYSFGTEAGRKALADLEAWTYDFLERRRRGAAREDIVQALFAGTVEEGRPLSDLEIMQILKLFVLGGLDTTTNATANALLHLAENPDLQGRLRNDPNALPRAVEEFLRYETIVTANSRYVARDIEIGGTLLRAGQTVGLLYGAGNRDPRAFDHPDEIDIDRPRKLHLTFAAGPHLCIGLHLARLEMRLALEEVLTRLSRFQLEKGAELPYHQGMARGLLALPVVFEQ